MAPPYSLKKLPSEVAAVLAPYAPYATTAAVRARVDESAAPDPEALVCLAFLQWQDGLTTDFDEDVLQFGAEALATLARHSALEAHAGATSLRREIDRRCKAARREIKKVEKLAAVPEDQLHIEDAKELVFVILDNSGASPDWLRKAHRLATRLVREVPDIVRKPREGGAVEEFHGNHLYHSNHAATALWRAGDHDAARPLLRTVVEWPVDRDVRLYSFAITECAEFLLGDAAARNDAPELARLLLHVQRRFAALGTALVLNHYYADDLLAYVITRADFDPDALRVLLGLYAERGERTMSTSTRAALAQLHARSV